MYVINAWSGTVNKIKIHDRNGDRFNITIVLSPEDEAKSLWGQIVISEHVSNIYPTKEAARRELFLRKLKGDYNG